jgi:hypothetical protein
MGTFNKIQETFLSEVRSKIPTNYSFAETIADDLNISIDSAYRRIRGDTHLTLDELQMLCIKYKVSIDSFFSSSRQTILFNYRAIDEGDFNFVNYFQSIIENLRVIQKYEASEIIYAAKDLPPFHLFMSPRLTAFKLYFWMSNIFHFSAFESEAFDESLIDPQLIDLGRKIWQGYLKVPSTEIWSEETINVTLRQIDFLYECGKIKTWEEAMSLYEEFRNVLFHIRKQASMGRKMDDQDSSCVEGDCSFALYYNEIVISDSTIFFDMGDFQMVHLGHNVMNILSTTDPTFCRHTKSILDNIIKNSTLMSVAAEKTRDKFFNILLNKVDGFIEKQPA